MVRYYLTVNAEKVGDCTHNVDDGVNTHLNTAVSLAYPVGAVIEVWRHIHGMKDRRMYVFNWRLREFVEE